MKTMYIIDNRAFFTKEALIKFLGNEMSKREDISQYNIIEVEYNETSETDGKTLMAQYITETDRELKINSVMGDDLATNFSKFKSMFLEVAENNQLKTKFIAKLESTPVTKDKISKLLKDNVGYLFAVNTSVEWYKTILSLHNFRKIEDSYHREAIIRGNLVTGRVRVNEEAKTNFNLAKK
jgi:hypothetical protein